MVGQGIGRYVVVAGPTGSGKSALALGLASALGGEIVGCDSVQLYRGFDLGSAKPTVAERALVPHHLVDIADWHESYDAGRYSREAAAALGAITGRGRLPIVVGGTGLYLRALLGQGFHADLPADPELRAGLAAEPTGVLYARLAALDPVRAAELHPNDRVRIVRSVELVTLLGQPLRQAGLTADTAPDPAALLVIIDPDRRDLHARIATRTDAMLAHGLLEEGRGLLAAGVNPACKPMQSIGYKQVVEHLADRLTTADLPAAIQAATRQYAKRQTTWFRRVDAGLRISSPDLVAVLAWLRPRLAGL